MSDSTGSSSVVRRSADVTSVLVLSALFTSPWTGVKALGLPITDLLLVAASVSLAFSALAGRRAVTLRPWTLAPALASLVVLAFDVGGGEASGITTIDPGGATFGGGTFAGQGGGLLFLGRIFIATFVVFVLIEAEVRRRGVAGGVNALEAFVWGTAASVGVAWYGDVTGNVWLDTGAADASVRAWGLAFHPNSLGQSVALAIPAIVCVSTMKPRGPVRFGVTLGLLSLMGWGLLLADSRGALAVSGVVAALLAGAWLMRKGRGRWFIPGGIFVAIAAAFAWPLFVSGTRLVGAGVFGISDSDDGRIAYLEDAWRLFAQYPILGAGLDAGSGVMVPAFLLSSGGVVLAGAYYFFVGRAFVAQWRRTSPLPRAYTSIGILALVLMGLPNNSINERFDFVMVAVAAACALQLGAPRKPATRLHSDARSRRIAASEHVEPDVVPGAYSAAISPANESTPAGSDS